MRMTVLISIVTGLFWVSAPGIWAGLPAGAPGGRVATPKLHVKGQGPVKNIRPNYITGWGYSPSQIKAAYGISGNGTGQTIAIVDAYGSLTINNDLSYFCRAFKLPQAHLTVYPMGGAGQQLGGDPDWALETSLDVEWAHALAPGASILLVVAQSNSFDDLFAAVQYAAQHASVVSMSWGGDEDPGEAGYDGYLQNPGTVFIASSGDSGSGAQYPAASPNVVAVGGTCLYLQPKTGTLKFPEVAWEGAGGGVSQYEPMPSYQTAFALPGQYRCVPDVGFVADPNTGVLVYDGNDYPAGWYVVGGTSLAAPCWAAIVALANQARAAAKLGPLTDGHQALYSLAATAANYAKYYRDITAGYNGDYAAQTGYDFITGIGSPKTRTLIPALKLVQ